MVFSPALKSECLCSFALFTVHWVNSVAGLAFGLLIKHEGSFIWNQYNGLTEPMLHNFSHLHGPGRNLFIANKYLAVCRLFSFFHKYQRLSSGKSGVSSEWTSNTKNCLSAVPEYLLLSYASWCPQKHCKLWQTSLRSEAVTCLHCNSFYKSVGLSKAFRYTVVLSIYLCLGNSRGWCREEDAGEGKSRQVPVLGKSRSGPCVHLAWSMNVNLIFSVSDWRDLSPAGYKLCCAFSGGWQSGINLLTLALWWRNIL